MAKRSYYNIFVSPTSEVLPLFVENVLVGLGAGWRICVQIDPYFNSLTATMHVSLYEKDGVDDASIFRGVGPDTYCITVHRHMPRAYETKEFKARDDAEASVSAIEACHFIIGTPWGSDLGDIEELESDLSHALD